MGSVPRDVTVNDAPSMTVGSERLQEPSSIDLMPPPVMLVISPIASSMSALLTSSTSIPNIIAVAEVASGRGQSTVTVPSQSPEIWTNPVSRTSSGRLTGGTGAALICSTELQMSTTSWLMSSVMSMGPVLLLCVQSVPARAAMRHPLERGIQVHRGLGSAEQQEALGPQLLADLAEDLLLGRNVEVDEDVQHEDEVELGQRRPRVGRSEEHTSELQSLMRISYAVFCFKKKTRRSILWRVYTSTALPTDLEY